MTEQASVVDVSRVEQLADTLTANLAATIHASTETLQLPLLALLTEGHVLIEDVPGVGKTMLAKALARSLELDFRRLQFTPDLLPGDVTGVNVFDQVTSSFRFRPGPLFGNVVLVDEVNRASPKTQSALLEAMQETQVTVDGETHVLERPFLVLATQNPVDYEGTFPLPEAQLDRFAVRMEIGYPTEVDEARLLSEHAHEEPIEHVDAVATQGEILAAIQAVRQVYVEDSINRYLVAIVRQTRDDQRLALGASPRAGIAVLRLAQARAAISGRPFVEPSDIRAVAVPALAHRLIVAADVRSRGTAAADLVLEIVDGVAAPL